MTLGSGARAPHPGGRLGPFEILGSLGQGGMGAVLHVFDTNGRRELALKLLATEQTTARHLERFRREGDVTARLHHPGIITVHDAGVIDGQPFIAYELVRGRDLDQALGDLDRDAALEILLQVAEAVGHAHANGVIHRDLKPANILIDEEGRARVADFGLAQAAGMERLTMTGALVGTPSYMAPEQVGGQREAYGPHTDVWALGVLLYVILTREEPFSAPGLLELAARIADSAPRPPRSSDSSVSHALEAVCLKALRKDPSERYPDANAFGRDLRHATERRVSQVTALQDLRRTRRRGALLLLLALVGVSAVVAAARSNPPVAPTPTATARPTDLVAAAERRRLQAQLDRALRLTSRVEADALVELMPSLDPEQRAAVRRARGAALAALEHHQPLRPCREHTAKLSAFRRALPTDPPPARLVELATASIRPVVSRIDRELSLLERWAEAGARLRDRSLGAELGEYLRTALDAHKLRLDEYWEALVTLSRLDITLGTFLLKAVEDKPSPWPGGARGWRLYVAMRARLHRTKEGDPDARALREMRQLRSMLEADPCWIGPVHWARTAVDLYDADKQANLKLLRAALERDPDCATALRLLSVEHRKRREVEQALDLAERARAAFNKHGFQGRISTLWEWQFVLNAQLSALLAAGRRTQARSVYLELRSVGSGDAKTFRNAHPWLDPEQHRLDHPDKSPGGRRKG